MPTQHTVTLRKLHTVTSYELLYDMITSAKTSDGPQDIMLLSSVLYVKDIYIEGS